MMRMRGRGSRRGRQYRAAPPPSPTPSQVENVDYHDGSRAERSSFFDGELNYFISILGEAKGIEEYYNKDMRRQVKESRKIVCGLCNKTEDFHFVESDDDLSNLTDEEETPVKPERRQTRSLTAAAAAQNKEK